MWCLRRCVVLLSTALFLHVALSLPAPAAESGTQHIFRPGRRGEQAIDVISIVLISCGMQDAGYSSSQYLDCDEGKAGIEDITGPAEKQKKGRVTWIVAHATAHIRQQCCNSIPAMRQVEDILVLLDQAPEELRSSAASSVLYTRAARPRHGLARTSEDMNVGELNSVVVGRI